MEEIRPFIQKGAPLHCIKQVSWTLMEDFTLGGGGREGEGGDSYICHHVLKLTHMDNSMRYHFQPLRETKFILISNKIQPFCKTP
jgi:hypothetical protein